MWSPRSFPSRGNGERHPMRSLVVLTYAVLALAAGCTYTYSVEIDGIVLGADKDTPRIVKADVIEGPEAYAAREAGGAHLKAIPEAKVSIGLQLKKDELPTALKTQKVDSVR